MRSRGFLIAIGILLPIAFAAGWLANRGRDMGAPESGARPVLYWVDPMNPSFRSPEPGTAPCGMPLEPVYADAPAAGPSGAAVPAGAVQVRADQLQFIGVERETVRPRTLRHTLRLVGTVAPDETRLYRITAATSLRIREVGGATTGSLVAKGEILGAYYTWEVAAPQLNYLRILEAVPMTRRPGGARHEIPQGSTPSASYERNLHVAHQTLMNLGMSAEQIAEIGRHGVPATLVQIRAPAAGFVLARNVSLGQSLDAGEELYTIADLSRVWILADAFEGQGSFFRPGIRATVSSPGVDGTIPAVVSAVLPRFDPATRTLKLRLEAPNPGFQLRPDMFVDVELEVEVGPGIFLPKEAVLDSGTRKIVFVEQEPGVFAPRSVRTGRRLGGRVEIVAGLMEGETAVTSGNFLLDSESRMRSAGASAGAAAAIDPICGMEVDEARARAQGLTSGHGGSTWFFCAPGCKQAFDRDPAAAAARARGTTAPAGEPFAPPAGQKGGAPAPEPDGARGPSPGSDGHDPMALDPMAHDAPAPADGSADKHGMGPGSAAGGGAMSMPADPAGGDTIAMPVDPVCGMPVDPGQARPLGLVSEHGGSVWYFCSPECKQSFDADPGAHLPQGR